MSLIYTKISFSGKKRSGVTGQDFADVEFYWDASTKSSTVDTLLFRGQGVSLGEFSATLEAAPSQAHRMTLWYIFIPTHLGLMIAMELLALAARLEVWVFFQGFDVIYNVTILTFFFLISLQ